MLGAIKLPSSGVSHNKFFNGRYPKLRLLGPTVNYLKVCGAVDPQQGGNQLSSSVYANQTLGHGSGNQHINIKNGVDSNRKPEYAKGTPLVDFFIVSR